MEQSHGDLPPQLLEVLGQAAALCAVGQTVALAAFAVLGHCPSQETRDKCTPGLHLLWSRTAAGEGKGVTRLWPFRVTFFVTALEYMDVPAIARTLMIEQTSRDSLTTSNWSVFKGFSSPRKWPKSSTKKHAVRSWSDKMRSTALQSPSCEKHE